LLSEPRREIKAKSGKSLSRFFPEVLDNLRALPTQQLVLDGELVIPVEGNLSFDAADAPPSSRESYSPVGA
jgi:ATP-dependent DNA ligase